METFRTYTISPSPFTSGPLELDVKQPDALVDLVTRIYHLAFA